MDIFLYQLIQFYSNNATNLDHLTTHSTSCCRMKWRSYCDCGLLWHDGIISPYV